MHDNSIIHELIHQVIEQTSTEEFPIYIYLQRLISNSNCLIISINLSNIILYVCMCTYVYVCIYHSTGNY